MACSPPLRPGWRLLGAIYPFAAGAAAVNVYFLSLIFSWWGLPVVSPAHAVLGGVALGLPATWAFARHIHRLMAKAAADS